MYVLPRTRYVLLRSTVITPLYYVPVLARNNIQVVPSHHGSTHAVHMCWVPRTSTYYVLCTSYEVHSSTSYLYSVQVRTCSTCAFLVNVCWSRESNWIISQPSRPPPNCAACGTPVRNKSACVTTTTINLIIFLCSRWSIEPKQLSRHFLWLLLSMYLVRGKYTQKICVAWVHVLNAASFAVRDVLCTSYYVHMYVPRTRTMYYVLVPPTCTSTS